MRMAKHMKRFLILVLSVTMIVSYMPPAVYAHTVPGKAYGEDVTEKGSPAEETSEQTGDLKGDPKEEDPAALNKSEGAAAEKTAGPAELPAGEQSAGTKNAEGDKDSAEGQGTEETEGSADNEGPKDLLESEGSDGIQAFVREAEIDHVIIRVDAEPGVFPVDAELLVEKVGKKEKAMAAEAVDEVRPEKRNVADSYTFDIKVVDAEGNELQPKDGEKVSVSFRMARAADPNLRADVYHITEKEKAGNGPEDIELEDNELEADKLKAETNVIKAAVTAETGGFSLYTVEFTYGNLSYTARPASAGGYQVSLQSIVDQVGIQGTAVTGAAADASEDCFSVSDGNVTFTKAFKDAEKVLKISVKTGEGEQEVTTDYEIRIVNCIMAEDAGGWSGLQEKINNAEAGQVIVLEGDITCDNNTSIKVSGKAVIIDLSGHTINRNRSSEDGDGHSFWVNNGGNLTICDSVGGGQITGGWADSGGAIDVQSGSTCTIESGTITGNHAKYGGGVIARGTLNVTGGSITGNTATYGGGVHITEEGGGVLNLSGGSVSNNTATDGGGVYVESNSTMNFSGGSISGNHANRGGGVIVHGTLTMSGSGKVAENNTLDGEHGGGVYVTGEGTFNLQDGSVEKNTAQKDGGGVYSEGNINITGGSIIANTAGFTSGAIFIRGGKTQISGGTISRNISYDRGGAIYIDKGTLDISGGKITNNTGTEGGGGIFVASGTDAVRLSGTPVVKHNDANDIHLEDGQMLTVTGKFQDGTSVGVYLKSMAGTFTTGYADSNPDVNPYEYFTPEAGYSVTADASGEACVITSEWLKLQRRIYDEEDGTTISLVSDWNAAAEDTTLTIPEGKTVTIDLNGHKIKRNLEAYKQNGEVFTVYGTLNIVDNVGGGVITGGYGEGGGFVVKSGGTLNLNAGTVSGNKGNTAGGGVLVEEGGKLNIDGGIIASNEAPAGGGVLNRGTLNLSGGAINSNNAKDPSGDGKGLGGGIYNAGTAVISDGAITANQTDGKGGGLYICKEGESAAKVTVSAGSVTQNSSTYGGAAYLENGAVLELTGGNLSLNSALKEAGGVWVNNEASLNVQGDPHVKENAGSKGKNILLTGGSAVNITGALSEGDGGAELDIAVTDADSAITNGLTRNNHGSKSVFSYNEEAGDDLLEVRNVSEGDDSSGELFFRKADADLWVSSWKELKDAIKDDANSGKTIGLNTNIAATSADKPLDVAEGRKVTIELNGHKIDRKASEYKDENNVFRVFGQSELTIRDSAGTGMITGGKGRDFGGGIYIDGGSTCILENVNIQSNASYFRGGGVYVKNGRFRMTGGSISDNKASTYGGGVYCTNDDTNDGTNDDTLELSGVYIRGNMVTNGDESLYGCGGGIAIFDDSHKKRTHSIQNCSIAGNEVCGIKGRGAGIYFDAPQHELTITDTLISGNRCVMQREEDGKVGEGGGIWLGLLTKIFMNGGSIIDNEADKGGGVMVRGNGMPESNGVFHGDHVNFVNNSTTKGDGGGIENYDGTTDLRNCKLSGNHASANGGAIASYGKLSMEDCEAGNNSASGAGGGIYVVYMESHLTNCEVHDNSSSGNGGGIAFCHSEEDWVASLTNVAVTGNKTGGDGIGGGIYLNSGKVSINGLTVTGNAAGAGGDGIWLDEEDGECNIEGAVVVKDNEGTNFYIGKDKRLNVNGPLTGSYISLVMQADTGAFTSGYSDENGGIAPEDYFAPIPGYSVVMDGGEAKVTNSNWPHLQTLIDRHCVDYDAEGDVLTLDQDYTAKEGDQSLLIPTNKKVVIDLNGHTIDRNLDTYLYPITSRDEGEVIRADGNLIIRDSSGGQGKITGGYGETVGGILGGGVKIEGGRITGNHGKVTGGVYGSSGGTIEMTGGEISGNVAGKYGGGIYAEGNLKVTGGTITSNLSEGYGGGIALKANGKLDLSGGRITGNSAVFEGGGIWFGLVGNKQNNQFQDHTSVTVSGAPVVTGNTSPTGNNILLKRNKKLDIAGPLTDGAALDLATQNISAGNDTQLTAGLKNAGAADDVIKYFTYNDKGRDSLTVNKKDDGYELYLKAVTADIWVSDWDALQTAINESSEDRVIGLKKDIDATDSAQPLTVPAGKAATVELAGYELCSVDRCSHIFHVKDGSSLRIRDSAGTGQITRSWESAIRIEENSTLNFEGGTISTCNAEHGGAIYVCNGGTLKMTGGSITNNMASAGGGAIYCDGNASDVTLEDVLIIGNRGPSYGGAIDTHAPMSLENCVIKNNRTISNGDGYGGGIFVTLSDNSKVLTLKDTKIEDNLATQNGGGIYAEVGTVEMRGGSVTGCSAGANGGGVFVQHDSEKEAAIFKIVNEGDDKTEISGNTSKDCGGVYNKGTIELSNTKIADNRATEFGGAGVNNKGTAALTNCEITGNYAKREGGAAYNEKGCELTITGGKISDNTAEEDGGAVSMYGDTDITDCVISGNKTKLSGGALRIRECTVTVTGGSMSENTANEYGGAIYISNGGTLSLIDGEITENMAGEGGGGIFVNSDTSAVKVEGSPVIQENDGGSNIFLVNGKTINVSNALKNGARIGVTLEESVPVLGNTSAFTSGFREAVPDREPSEFFVSDDGYDVVLIDNEAVLKRAQRDKNPFIDSRSQMVRDYNTLSSADWMAGISGERYLYEINIPGTHDSGTNVVEGNISTGKLSTYAAIAGFVLPQIAGAVLTPFTGGASLLLGNIMAVAGPFAAPILVSEYFKKYANCQERFIDEQLEDGIRQFDIRLNTYYAEQGFPVKKRNDGENLYLLHGKDPNAGSYFCKDHDDEFLTFQKVLEWSKDFLDRHPTETIILDLQIDSVDIDDVYDDGIARITKHLRTLSEEINPSTGRSYLYMEGGVFGRAFTREPQLKDCRGQIVILADKSEVNTFGGATGIGMGKDDASAAGSFKDNAEAKIENLKTFYEKYAGKPLPTDADHTAIDTYYHVGTNGTDTAIPPDRTPLDISRLVLPVLFDEEQDGILLNREGTYLGLVNMDGVHTRQADVVWRSNYFDGLEYCTVKAVSGTEVKTYTVLSGTTIIIPSGVFQTLDQSLYFAGWDADVRPEGHTNNFIPGELYTVTEDVTFTARWSKNAVTPVRVVWKDGDDADGLRPDTLNLLIRNASTEEQQAASISASNSWGSLLEDNVGSISVDWDKAAGDSEDTYKYEIKGSTGGAFVITMTHTPDKKISGAGSISWSGMDEGEKDRPESVTVKLLKGTEIIDTKTVTAEDNWSFDFGQLPKYKRGEEIEYSIATDAVENYNSHVVGFDVKNFLRVPETLTLFEGWVLWEDEDNPKRPKEISLKLMKGDEEVGHRTVRANEDGEWPFSFYIDSNVRYSDYKVVIDGVPDGYNGVVNMGKSDGDLVHVLMTRSDHEHSSMDLPVLIKPPTCTESGKRYVFKYCEKCGTLLSSDEETVDPMHTFAYTLSDDKKTITATCLSEDCPDGYHGKGIAVTLNAPEDLVSDGDPKEASISGYPDSEVPGGLEKKPEISYYRSTGAGSTTPDGEALSGAPADAGDYVAQITMEEVTASVPFTLTKRDDMKELGEAIADVEEYYNDIRDSSRYMPIASKLKEEIDKAKAVYDNDAADRIVIISAIKDIFAAKAEAAQKVAESDKKAAEEAQARAEAAAKEALAAKEKAEADKKAVEEAQAKAEAAEKEALAAKARAEEAKAAADKAKAEAEAAQKAAEKRAAAAEKNAFDPLKKAKFGKVKGGKKKVTIRWKAVKGAEGYIVKIGKNRKVTKKTKTYTVKGTKKLKKVIRKLKKGRYYVKVRAYKTYKGNTVYGKFSKVKKVRVK